MKEKDFINKNKEKWQKLEEIVFENKKDNSKNLADYFTQTTEDLAYARTFYPNRSVRLYLNNLSQNIYNKIYRNKAIRFEEVKVFFKYILPATMFEYRRTFYLCIALFIISLSIGIISSANDADFARQILGDGYVRMTENNIKNNDPMAVYKQGTSMVDFLWITENNIKVSLLTFVSGILAGIGSLGIMIQNGVMVGVFQYFFYERGLLIESFLTIWMHGAFEICSIVIAATAGMVLGSGYIFPGTYSRFLAFRYSALAGLRIIVGVIPFIIVAGFIEGFLTRYTDIHLLIKAFFIFSCFGFMIFYFIIYPQMLASKGLIQKYLPKIVPYTPNPVANKNWGILSHAELFSESAKYMIKFTFPLFIASLVAGIVLFISNYFFTPEEYAVYFEEDHFFKKIFTLHNLDGNRIANFIAYSFIYTLSHFVVKYYISGKYKFNFQFIITIILVAIVNYFALFINLFNNALLGLIIVPYVLYINYVLSDSKIALTQKLGFLITSFTKSTNQMMIKLPSIVPVLMVAFGVMSTPIMGFYLGMIYMNVQNPEKGTITYFIIENLPQLLNFIVFSFIIGYGNVFVKTVYDNVNEIASAKELSKIIENTLVKK